jgi:hypothetical protein
VFCCEDEPRIPSLRTPSLSSLRARTCTSQKGFSTQIVRRKGSVARHRHPAAIGFGLPSSNQAQGEYHAVSRNTSGLTAYLQLENINRYAQATAYLRLENINRYAQATAYPRLENRNRYAQATAYLRLENINRYAQATAYLRLENRNRYAQATAYLRLENINRYAQTTAYLRLENINRYAQPPHTCA